MAGSASQAKEVWLQGTALFFSNYLQRMDETSLLITWHVTNYSKLKKNILYYQSTIDFGRRTNRWAMKLIKVRGTLFFILSTNAEGKFVRFGVNSYSDLKVKGSVPTEIRSGLYVGEFCREAIEDPENEVLYSDTLTVHCRFAIRSAEQKSVVLPNEEHGDTDNTLQLCDDIKSLFTLSRVVDMVIHLGITKFYVHKVILAARSTYFSELFEKDCTEGFERKELCINARPIAMREILLYIYSGELSQGLGDRGMLQVFCLAHTMKLNCVIEKCKNFFKNNLTANNAVHIYKVATLCNHEDLKHTVIHYLNNIFENVKDTKQWEFIMLIEKLFGEKKVDEHT